MISLLQRAMIKNTQKPEEKSGFLTFLAGHNKITMNNLLFGKEDKP